MCLGTYYWNDREGGKKGLKNARNMNLRKCQAVGSSKFYICVIC